MASKNIETDNKNPFSFRPDLHFYDHCPIKAIPVLGHNSK